MRMCVLEEDLRPDDPSITLTCSAAGCAAPIRKGQRYGIRPGTNLIYCAACAARPILDEPPSPAATPVRAWRPPGGSRPRIVKVRPPKKASGGQPLAPGMWSLRHERCLACGATERPHHSRGLCQRCNSADQRRNQPTMAAQGLSCRACGRDDEPAKARGMCTPCYKRQYHATRLVTTTGVHPSSCACFSCADERQMQHQRPRGVDWRGMPFAEATL